MGADDVRRMDIRTFFKHVGMEKSSFLQSVAKKVPNKVLNAEELKSCQEMILSLRNDLEGARVNIEL